MCRLFNKIYLFILVIGLSVYSQGDKKIVGGLHATLGQFPHQVSIQRKYGGGFSHFCGGSLIKPNYVLTAAHCMESRIPSDIRVRAGKIDLDDLDAETRIADKIIVHEKYDSEMINFDVAVIRLKKPFTETKYIKTIELANTRVRDYTRSIVSGWGETDQQRTAPMRLLYTYVNTVPQNDCKKVYQTLTENMLCAGDSNGGHDACQGDSGGPLIHNNTQIGIVSYGSGCGRPGYPGVYSDVPKLLPWIEENTNISARIYIDKTIFPLAFILILFFVN